MHRMAHTLTVCWIMVSNALVWGEPLSSLPDSVRFGPVRVSDSATDTLWLHNTLGTEWMVDSASVSGDTFRLCPSPFTGSPIRLGPDEALPLPIGFTPVDTITYTDCLDLFAEGAVRSIRVLGTGVMEVVVIDEIHADPAAGLVGDANGDGLRSSSEDEFVGVSWEAGLASACSDHKLAHCGLRIAVMLWSLRRRRRRALPQQ